MEKHKRVAIFVSVLVALVVLVGAKITFAQEPTLPDSLGSRSEGGHPTWPGPGRGPGIRDNAALNAAIAELLGMSVEELEGALADGETIRTLIEESGLDMAEVQTALQTARAEMLQQAVADGSITQEQADQMLDRQSEPKGSGRVGKGGFGLKDKDDTAWQTTLAEVLGISVEQLEGHLAGGETIRTLVETLGFDMAEVQAALQAARAEMLQQAVADGSITQEQADRMLDHQREPKGFGHEGKGRHGLRDKDDTVWRTTFAEVLGISVEELEKHLAGGETIRTLVETLGFDMAEVQAALQAARAEMLQQAVADGSITQEKADRMLNHLSGRRNR